MFKTIEWTDEGVRMIDQTRLPAKEIYRLYQDYRGVAEAIRSMVIRGAPAIGVAAAMGVALGIKNSRATNVTKLRVEFDTIAEAISRTRPTAVNLFWAVKRMRAVFEEWLARPHSGSGSDQERIAGVKARLVEEAQRILAEDVAVNEAMGRHGAALLDGGWTVLTHCNAGALATGGYGTALGVIRAAVEAGKRVRVLADETRPYLQGARLTAWELSRDGIPVEVIADSMAAHFMKRGEIGAVVVGADRIAKNGDVANKIGTYGVACLARAHGVPFYVAAPWSTVDLDTPDGEAIPIEERSRDEVAFVGDRMVVPEGVGVRHPAFDVTPAALVTAIFTERGEASPDRLSSLGAGQEVDR
jgi:methylthioribose-1-phosphate isomerase